MPSPTSREGGRYQRPTVWRPPAIQRGDVKRRTAAASPAVDVFADRYANAPRNPAPSTGRAIPRELVEPVAPIGWLGSGSGTRAGSREGAGSSRVANPGTVGPATAPAASRGFVRTDASTQTPKTPPSAAPRTTVAASAAHAIQPSRSSVRRPAASMSRPATGNFAAPPGATPRAPMHSRPAEPPGPPPAPDAIQATLRSIEENAARWTALAGAGLASGRESQERQPGLHGGSDHSAATRAASEAPQSAANTPPMGDAVRSKRVGEADVPMRQAAVRLRSLCPQCLAMSPVARGMRRWKRVSRRPLSTASVVVMTKPHLKMPSRARPQRRLCGKPRPCHSGLPGKKRR